MFFHYVYMGDATHMVKSKLVPAGGHCVIYGVESFSGAMEWSFGVDFGV